MFITEHTRMKDYYSAKTDRSRSDVQTLWVRNRSFRRSGMRSCSSAAVNTLIVQLCEEMMTGGGNHMRLNGVWRGGADGKKKQRR